MSYDTKPSWLPRGSHRAFERELESVDRAMDYDPALDDVPEDESDEERRDAYGATRAAPEIITVELSVEACKPRRPNAHLQDDGVIFTETHADHPGGQVVVVKGRRVRVARTERVRRAIANGLLVITSEPETPVMSSEDLLHEVERTLAALPRTWLEEPSPAVATQPAQPAETPTPHVRLRRTPRDERR